MARRLNYRYLGTVVKGNCAFIDCHKEQQDILKKQLGSLGRTLSQTGEFDKKLKEEMAMPYQFSKGLLRLLKENYVLKEAKAQPFLKEP